MSVEPTHPLSRRYGADPDQVAELLLPDGHGSHPVVALLHGGFWRAPYTCSLMDAIAVALADRGWASWNVEYRRGAGRGRTSVDDVGAALDALRTLDAPIDHQRLVVIGHSAGGHLALCTAAGSGAKLVISLAGVCDLVAAAGDDLGNGAAVEFMGVTPTAAADAYAAADPTALLPCHTRILLVHGDADEAVPVAQSRAYLAAARAAADDCELLELPGVDHMALIDPRTAAFDAWARRLDDER